MKRLIGTIVHYDDTKNLGFVETKTKEGDGEGTFLNKFFLHRTQIVYMAANLDSPKIGHAVLFSVDGTKPGAGGRLPVCYNAFVFPNESDAAFYLSVGQANGGAQ